MRIAPGILAAASLAGALLMTASLSVAQTYPSKPIRLIVPSSTGTPVDILSRVVANNMSSSLGQPVVVLNRTGAGGIIGAQELLNQPADGYTLMTLYRGMTITQTIFPNVTFDLKRDFAPIGQILQSSNVLVVSAKVPAKNLQELAAFVRSQSGKTNFASGGIGSPAHLWGELFAQRLGVQMTHIPYITFPQAISDLLGGQVELMFAATPPVVGHIESGKLRALAVTGERRVPSLKDVPTMTEAGMPGFTMHDWQGLLARAGTPAAIVDRLNQALRESLASDEVAQAFARLGSERKPSSPAEFATLIAETMGSLNQLVKSANIRAQ